MGRKIEIKRIENLTRRQVTYSKRRSSLIKKANEISVFCDIDVLFIAFSHSGRLNTFCSRDRIEDVIERYMNLPPTCRYPRAKNIQGKVQKLKELDHITDDEKKSQHLDNEIEQLEEQIKKKQSEIEILHHKLNEFEPDAENATLSQVLSLEEHFKNSLKLVKDRKKSLVANPSSSSPTEFTSEDDNDQNIEEVEKVTRRRPRDHRQRDQLQTILKNIDENQLIYELQDPTSSQILLQLDPWLISNNAPNRWSRARGRVTGSDLIIEPSEETSAGNVVHGVSSSSIDSLSTVTTGFPSNADQFSNWFIPQTNISTHHGLIQQPLTTTGFPNQQMWGSSSSFGLAMPENSSGESTGVALEVTDFGQFGAPTTNNQVNWFNASGSFGPYYSITNVDAANYIPTTINGYGISENNVNGSIAASFDQVIPEAESSVQAETRNSNNMCTTAAGNQEAMDDVLGWDLDDSILLEKVNFEDLETIFD